MIIFFIFSKYRTTMMMRAMTTRYIHAGRVNNVQMKLIAGNSCIPMYTSTIATRIPMMMKNILVGHHIALIDDVIVRIEHFYLSGH